MELITMQLLMNAQYAIMFAKNALEEKQIVVLLVIKQTQEHYYI